MARKIYINKETLEIKSIEELDNETRLSEEWDYIPARSLVAIIHGEYEIVDTLRGNFLGIENMAKLTLFKHSIDKIDYTQMFTIYNKLMGTIAKKDFLEFIKGVVEERKITEFDGRYIKVMEE